MVEVKPGAAFRSAVCEVEAVVVKATGTEVDLRCGGQPMVAKADPPGEPGVPTPGFDTGSSVGKRYADEAGTIEVLCTKAGPSAFSLGDELLVLKAAKPLPSSD